MNSRLTEQHSVPYNLLELAIGSSVEILSNDYNEFLSSYGEALSHHNIVFQIKEDSPDILSMAVLFALPFMSFTYDSPRGYQEKLRELVAMATVVPVSSGVVLSRDPNDDHYLSLCKETEADFLVTGDKDLLAISTKALLKNGIMTRIVTPHDFLSEQ